MIHSEANENWGKYDIKAPNIDADLEAAVHSAMQHYKLHHFKKLLKECQVKIKEAKTPEEVDSWLKKFMALKEMRREICAELGIVVLE